MNRHPHEPLTDEERELAQLIARVGPHGEPPAALDAKILAAAHAAVAGKPQSGHKPRWPVAMGLAASVVFAVGIAWQLRPVQPVPSLASEASEALATAAAETATQPEAEPATEAEPPLPLAAVAQDSAAADVPMYAPPPPPPPAAKPLPPRTVPKPPSRRAARIASPETPSIQRRAKEGDRYHSLDAVPPPSAPAAPAMAAAASAAEAPAAFAAEPSNDDVVERPSANEAAGYSAARTTAAKQAAARGEMKASAAIREQERSAQESSARDRTTLDRVEVTGSRLQRTDLQVPITDDARLPVDEWLERVRTRYGLGDAEAAKRSLLLFVREHPSESVPGDLEPLLEK